MKRIKNAAIEETTFTVRGIDQHISPASGRDYITLELVGEGGALDGLITYATVFPNIMRTTQTRNVLHVLDDELNRDD